MLDSHMCNRTWHSREKTFLVLNFYILSCTYKLNMSLIDVLILVLNTTFNDQLIAILRMSNILVSDSLKLSNLLYKKNPPCFI